MQFIHDDADMVTRMVPGLRGFSLACVRQINLLDRIKAWSGCLPETFNMGCALNSLVFMGEMSYHKGCIEGKRVVYTQPLGTPYDHIINWFNLKNKMYHNNVVFKELKKSLFDLNGDITSMIEFFEKELPEDSCTIIKFNRMEDMAKKHNLCPGHTILIGKDSTSKLWYVDPQRSNFLPMREYMTSLVKDFEDQFYLNFSISTMMDPNVSENQNHFLSLAP